MDKAIQDKIFAYIDALASKLGVASQYVMETLVRQQVIEGITTIATLALFAVIDAVLIVIAVRTFKTFMDVSREYDAEQYGSGRYTANKFEGKRDRSGAMLAIFGISAAILTLIVLLATAASLPEAFGKLLNPQYYAIKDIIDAIK